MRGAGQVAVGAVLTSVLVGCGAGAGGDADGSAAPAVEAEPAMMSRSAVQGDIRAAVATGDFGRVRFGEGIYEGRRRDCEFSATVVTPHRPAEKPLKEVVAALKALRWKQSGNIGDENVEGWLFEKGSWTVDLLAGTVPTPDTGAVPSEQGTEVKAVNGLQFRGLRRGCGATTPSPAP